MVTGWNQTLVAAMKQSSSNGEKVVKQKRCRKGQKKSQGTSQTVRKERPLFKIEGLTSHLAVFQENYDLATRDLTRVLAERDTARTQLKISEKTSAQRLLLIQREVPNFSRYMLKGKFDSYKASL